VIAQHHLGDDQDDQLAVAHQWLSAATGTRWYHMIVAQHVQCGQEGVQVFAHILIMNTPPPSFTAATRLT